MDGFETNSQSTQSKIVDNSQNTDQTASMSINVPNVALIFEGGGMRNAYTAAVVTTLLAEGLYFPKAYGVSAGSALAAGYVAQDPTWTRNIFTDTARLKKTGGAVSFLTGHGFFNTEYVFGDLAEHAENAKSPWYFDFDTFQSNPADVHIEALNETNAQTVAWTKSSMPTLHDVLVRIEASCSYPLFTPPIRINGDLYVDGGMGTSHGICLDAARRDGFEKFFIVRTQPRAYRMPPLRTSKHIAYDVAYCRHRKVYHALVDRPKAYDALLDEIEQLRSEGIAYVFCPETMSITYMTKNYQALTHAYELGIEQCKKELPQWRQWLARA